MKIYLADLIYDTVDTNYTIPLNIGFIAAYLKEMYPNEVEIQLFKHPKKLEDAIKKSPPDILGLSHYGWNERLNNIFFNLSKQINNNVINVIGGPNIRHDIKEIETFLLTNLNIDYAIMFEGEKSFSLLVNNIINNKNKEKISPPNGCATLINNSIHYNPTVFQDKNETLNLPSPYLNGILDEFIKEKNIIPLFESNRGCPYGCTYCAWGVSALSKIKKRSLEIVLQELEYVAENSEGQVNWIFTDANFGMFERDIEIAKKIREIKDKKGYPLNVTLWHSKNTSDRNIEISNILGNSEGYIAIQSSDSNVLKNAGRGKISFIHLEKQIEYYKNKNLNVQTDILLGLPGETKQSHMKTLFDAFTLGFDKINPYNIRMLQGTDYDSKEHRDKYKIITKYRPIFGSYGIYNNQIVFELEESVRATGSMSEDELESFKLLHWLIYFSWNSGIFKPFLKYALAHDINPMTVLNEILETKNPRLENVFAQMKKESESEWFNTKEEMINYYQKRENYEKLVNSFTKLNFYWISKFFSNKELLTLLNNEFQSIIEYKLYNLLDDSWHELKEIHSLLIVDNLLQNTFEKKLKINGKSLEYISGDNRFSKSDILDIVIYRDEQSVSFCQYRLNKNGKENMSIQNITSFLEMGGMRYLKNNIKVI